MRIRSMILAGAATILCLGGAMAQQPASSPTQQKGQLATPAAPIASAAAPVELVEAPGKDRLLAGCNGCHEASIVVGQHRDLAGWHELIDQMIARGAPVSAEDQATIAKYLAENPSTRSPT
jgi:cytochrome c5